jgi:hyperosmotically inducible protein
MMKRLSVGICGLAVVFMTAGLAQAQSTTQEVKEKTATAAQKTGAYLSDTEITTVVKSKLLADKAVSGLKIGVETDNGVVTLTGTVATAAERAHAANVARHTDGVKRVVDKVMIEKKSAANSGIVDKTENGAKKTGEAVKGTSGTVAKDTEEAAKKTSRFFTDAEITAAVKTKLAADSGVHVMDVHVDTDKGVVTLTGSVRSDAEKADAARITRDTLGVKNVVNKLTVK